MITKANAEGALIHEDALPAVNTAVTVAETKTAASAALLETRAPEGVWVNGIPLVRDLTFTTDDLNTYNRETIDQKIAAIAGGGYNPVHVNGHLLDRDIILTPADLDMPTKSEFDAGGTNFVPTSRTVNSKALTGDIVLSASDVGTYSTAEVADKVAAFVPGTRTVNGHPLSADVTLTAADVGAPAKADVVPPTFTINGIPLTGAGITLSGSGDVYTQEEIYFKLNGYMYKRNEFGLGNVPIPLTSGTLAEGIHGSGLYTYAPGTDEDEDGNPIDTAHEDAPPGSTHGAIIAVATGDDTTPGLSALAITKEGDLLSRTGTTWEKVGTEVPDVPVPDLWLPLNDSLVMITGEAPYDQITVNGSPLDLASKSATFKRASTATYIRKDGQMDTAAIDQPRYEKDGLLIESQSTNLLPYSQNFDTTQPIGGKFWPYENNMITTLKPDGSWHIENNTSSTTTGENARRMLITTQIQLKGDTTYTFSARGMNGSHTALVYGSIFGPYDATAKVEREILVFPDGAWGVDTLTFTTVQDGWAQFEIYGSTDINSTVFDPFELHYVQLEGGNVATSYIVTSGTPATRAADICTVPVVNIGGQGEDITISAEISNINLSWEAYPRILTTCTYEDNKGFFFVCNEDYPTQWGANSLLVEGPESQIYTSVTTPTGAKLYVGEESADMPGMNRGTVRDTSAMIFGRTIINASSWNIRNLRVWNYALTDEQIRGLA